ncbi:MAG: S9 family peptidase, partial [Proteobacteria bacterium]
KASHIPLRSFNADGSLLALGIDSAKGIELWLVTVKTGKARQVKGVYLNDSFVSRSMIWNHDDKSLLIAARVDNKIVLKRETLDTPSIEEASGTKIQARSYPYLLRTESDRKLFERAAGVQIMAVDTSTLKTRLIGKPVLLSEMEPAPDGKHLLVQSFAEPFSFAVPAERFGEKVEIWDLAKGSVQSLLSIALAENVPPEGVRTGPRGIGWQVGHPARLLWVEALDEGDPRKKVEHRDRLMSWDLPFKGEAEERFRMKNRFSSIRFMPENDRLLIGDSDRDSFQTLVHQIDLKDAAQKKLILDYNSKDVYNFPGNIVMQPDGSGEQRVVTDGDWIFLDGNGRNPSGEKPFLDRLNLKTGVKERLFESDGASEFLEEFSFFLGRKTNQLVLSRQSASSPPNLWAVDPLTKTKKQLTQRIDNVPEMSGAIKKPLIYTRKDGLTLSATLYLPKDYKEGTKLPAIIWAYPEEYRAKDAAGQVRVSDKRYSRPSAIGIAWLVTQGFAILDNAAMPIVGEKETGNDAFIEQTVSNAEAAVDALDKLGVVDRKRIAVGGHSYGAFMTANLLAHSNLFCAGIARSGAYNRSLTPFGFQSERRTFWEAKDFYMNVSPFAVADKIKTPLLLIHGKDDNNPGTLTMQSERMFQAVRGVGGVARLVLLPYESHGYIAKENVQLMHNETMSWLNRFCGEKK